MDKPINMLSGRLALFAEGLRELDRQTLAAATWEPHDWDDF